MIQDKDALADPEQVAQDGYAALMEGRDQVISGFKNKMNVVMSNIIPDSAAANSMKDVQEPVGR